MWAVLMVPPSVHMWNRNSGTVVNDLQVLTLKTYLTVGLPKKMSVIFLFLLLYCLDYFYLI